MTASCRPSKKTPSLLKAAGLIAIVTVLAKVLGAVRDWSIFNAYGASLATDAYFSAVQLPWFAIVLLGGLGGPFHTATIAIFAKLIKNGEYPEKKARKLASTFITLTGLTFAGLAILVYGFSEPIMRFLLPDASGELLNRAAEQLRIMSPVVLFGGLIGIFYGLLNVYHSFVWPSLSPAAMSLVIIGALFLNPGDGTGHVLAYATMAGALCQLLLQLPDFLKYRFSLRPALDLNHPEIRQLGEVLFPIIIGTTIGQLIVYVDMFFVAQLQEGGWSAIVLSNRLLQLPIGVLQTALLVPIFPRFSRYVAEKNWDGLKKDFRIGVVALWFISIPILIVILFYTEPIIRTVFEHGRFDAGDTAMVTVALIFQAFQMLPYFARDTMTRVFYAFNDSMVPMLIGFLALGIKFGLNYVLVQHYGIGGITLATTLITFFNMTLLAIFLRRHIRPMGYSALLIPFGKLLFAGAGMGSFLFLAGFRIQESLMALFQPIISNATLLEIVPIGLTSLIGLGIYGGIALALKVDEAQYLFDRLRAYTIRKA